MKKLIVSLLVVLLLAGCVSNKTLEQAKAIARQETLAQVLNNMEPLILNDGRYYEALADVVLLIERIGKENRAKYLELF